MLRTGSQNIPLEFIGRIIIPCAEYCPRESQLTSCSFKKTFVTGLSDFAIRPGFLAACPAHQTTEHRLFVNAVGWL